MPVRARVPSANTIFVLLLIALPHVTRMLAAVQIPSLAVFHPLLNVLAR